MASRVSFFDLTASSGRLCKDVSSTTSNSPPLVLFCAGFGASGSFTLMGRTWSDCDKHDKPVKTVEIQLMLKGSSNFQHQLKVTLTYTHSLLPKYCSNTFLRLPHIVLSNKFDFSYL